MNELILRKEFEDKFCVTMKSTTGDMLVLKQQPIEIWRWIEAKLKTQYQAGAADMMTVLNEDEIDIPSVTLLNKSI